MDIPLTFLTDDILREMDISQNNYFLLNKENARDGRNHYFHFESVFWISRHSWDSIGILEMIKSYHIQREK